MNLTYPADENEDINVNTLIFSYIIVLSKPLANLLQFFC